MYNTIGEHKKIVFPLEDMFCQYITHLQDQFINSNFVSSIARYVCLVSEKVAHSREWKHWKSENAFVAFIKCAPAQHIAIKLSFQELIFESMTETLAREAHRNMKCHA